MVEKALEENKRLSQCCEDLEKSVETLKNIINVQATYMEGVGGSIADLAEISENLKILFTFKQEQEQKNFKLNGRITRRRGEIDDLRALVRDLVC